MAAGRIHNVVCLFPFNFLLSKLINQFEAIMQNKPNFQKSQMNVNLYNTKVYKNETAFRRGKNKPNQSQSPKSQNEYKLTYKKGLQKKR